MRARKVVLALGALLAVACGSVPDLRFGDGDDAGVTSGVDSSLPPPTPTATSTAGEAGSDGATTNPSDGSSPVDSGDDSGGDSAAPVCPANPPKGDQCCGSILCRPGGGIGPGGSFCNCNFCGGCASQGVCCLNKQGGFESCATSIESCPAP
jgi:hypothetical protein